MQRTEAILTTDGGVPSRHELVVIPGGASSDASSFRRVPNRPLAGFLAQLLVDADPTLRPPRSERTRSAAAHYAEAARRA